MAADIAAIGCGGRHAHWRDIPQNSGNGFETIAPMCEIGAKVRYVIDGETLAGVTLGSRALSFLTRS